jgi:hypothetical protein
MAVPTATLEDRERMMETITFKEDVMIAPREVIYFAAMNEARHIVQTDDDGNAITLRDKIGNDDDAIVKEAVYPPVLRLATKDERERWKEEHAQVDWFKEIPSDEQEDYVPEMIVCDGFGRFDSHVNAHGDLEPIKCRVIDEDVPEIAAEKAKDLALNLDSQRPLHWLDKARLLADRADKLGLKQKQLAERYGYSAGAVSELLMVWRNATPDELALFTAKNIGRLAARDMIQKRLDEKSGKKDRVQTENGKRKVPSVKRRLTMLDNVTNLLDDEDAELTEGDEAYLQGLKKAFEVNLGEVDIMQEGGERLLDVIQADGFLQNVDLSFETELVELTVESYFAGLKVARDTEFVKMVEEDLEDGKIKHIDEVAEICSGFVDEPLAHIKFAEIKADARIDAIKDYIRKIRGDEALIAWEEAKKEEAEAAAAAKKKSKKSKKTTSTKKTTAAPVRRKSAAAPAKAAPAKKKSGGRGKRK